MELARAVARFVTDPTAAALACDYDGTLAPIVDDPDAAAPMPDAVDALRAVVAADVEVAIISGRPISFLRTHLDVAGCVLIGQYGLESLQGDTVVVDPRAEVFLAAVHDAERDAAETWPGLRVEHKGDLAFTVHWRTTPDLAPAPGALEELAARYGLVVQPGRQAGEVRTPVPMDKGVALNRWLVTRGRPLAAFVGDDVGDLDAFDALDRWCARADDREALRVAVSSDEAPAELLERADLVVDGPEGAVDLLRRMTTPG